MKGKEKLIAELDKELKHLRQGEQTKKRKAIIEVVKNTKRAVEKEDDYIMIRLLVAMSSVQVDTIRAQPEYPKGKILKPNYASEE